LIAGSVGYIETLLAKHLSFASAMAVTAVCVFAFAIVVVLVGPEKRGIRFAESRLP
jgi:hypothetical protein